MSMTKLIYQESFKKLWEFFLVIKALTMSEKTFFCKVQTYHKTLLSLFKFKWFSESLKALHMTSLTYYPRQSFDMLISNFTHVFGKCIQSFLVSKVELQQELLSFGLETFSSAIDTRKSFDLFHQQTSDYSSKTEGGMEFFPSRKPFLDPHRGQTFFFIANRLRNVFRFFWAKFIVEGRRRKSPWINQWKLLSGECVCVNWDVLQIKAAVVSDSMMMINVNIIPSHTIAY